VKQIIALVKPFRAPAVMEAVGSFPIELVTVREARGYGRQKDRLPEYRGSEFSGVYLPKIEISVLVEDEHAGALVERIIAVARTGRIGDGKILVFDSLGEFAF